MSKSAKGRSQSGGSAKGDGGRKPPSTNPKPQPPNKSKSTGGDSGRKPPKGKP
jgi:hypothetical protein